MSAEPTRDLVLVVGSANMDMVVSCERFPQPGETLFGTDFGLFPGGKGANQAVACARLGGQVQFIGRLGNDLFGERLGKGLREDGIGLDGLAVDPAAPTGTALITVDRNAQNEIIVVSGSNMRLSPDDLDAAVGLFDRASVVLLQLEIPIDTVGHAARLARHRGCRVILNPAPAQVLDSELLSMVDYLTPNETEASLLSGIPVRDRPSARRAAEALLSRGVGAVIVTLGADGSLLVSGQQATHFPAHPVAAVDTTAAGDAFNGAFAFALAAGATSAEAIRLASAVAAVSVTRPGAQTSMPTLHEAAALMEGAGGDGLASVEKPRVVPSFRENKP